jgi:hypothetical protein
LHISQTWRDTDERGLHLSGGVKQKATTSKAITCVSHSGIIRLSARDSISSVVVRTPTETKVEMDTPEGTRRALENIVLIIDFEGFQTVYGFHIKEFGSVKMTDGIPSSDFVELPLRYHELNEKDRVMAAYVKRNIHGLRYDNNPYLDLSIKSMKLHIKKMYENLSYANPDALVAYKGGHIERDLLKEIGIPSVNLEHLGLTSKFDKLDIPIPDSIKPCSRHAKIPNVHCPIVELYVFYTWIKQQLVDSSGGANGQPPGEDRADRDE